jgi:hypothetical protein
MVDSSLVLEYRTAPKVLSDLVVERLPDRGRWEENDAMTEFAPSGRTRTDLRSTLR